MKRLYICLLLILIPTILLAQYRYDGRRIWPSTIDSTKFTQDRSAAIGPGVIGNNQMYDATFGEIWIPADWDSGGATVTTLLGSGAWAFGADNMPTLGWTGTEPNFKYLGFDGGGGSADDSAWVIFHCPANYKDNTMELYLYWMVTEDAAAITDSIRWCGRVLALASAATDSTADLWDAGTAMTDVAEVLTYSGPGSDGTADSLLHITNLDPEVTEIDPNDLIKVLLYIDESRSGLGGGVVALWGLLIRWDIADTP